MKGVRILKSKIITLKDFCRQIEDLPPGFSLGLGGQSISMNPMGLVKAILSTKITKKLPVIASPIGGLATDLLIGAGAVSSLEFAQVSLWEFGMAPNFRRAAQEGTFECLEHT